ncbi:fas-binding factor 1 homolog, partial [Neopelma chrysocephalum]|uniref:fas-binding factor 1 homolog n=1 Tax=Neopelma chrysocephalum TaxID=114329 RepID=UPI000FCD0671
GAWLEEQRAVLRECSEERRRLEKAWAEFRSRERLSQERSEHLESTLRNLDKEQAALQFRARELRSQEERLEREREALEDSRRELRLEREKVLRDTERLRQREQEVQALAELSERQSRDGARALREARNVEAEQRERLRAGREQLEQLREQEQRLEQDRLSLAQQRRQLQRLRQELSPQELSVPGTLLGTARERPIPREVIPGERLHIPLGEAPAFPGCSRRWFYPLGVPPVGFGLLMPRRSSGSPGSAGGKEGGREGGGSRDAPLSPAAPG